MSSVKEFARKTEKLYEIEELKKEINKHCRSMFNGTGGGRWWWWLEFVVDIVVAGSAKGLIGRNGWSSNFKKRRCIEHWWNSKSKVMRKKYRFVGFFFVSKINRFCCCFLGRKMQLHICFSMFFLHRLPEVSEPNKRKKKKRNHWLIFVLRKHFACVNWFLNVKTKAKQSFTYWTLSELYYILYSYRSRSKDISFRS